MHTSQITPLPLASVDNSGFKANVLEDTPEPIVARSSIGMSANKGVVLHMTHNSQAGSFVYQESFSAPQRVVVNSIDAPERVQGEVVQFTNSGVPQMGSNQNSSSANVSYNRPLVRESPVDNGSTTVLVGELHWWTTDADLESVLSCYGRVKEIKFFDERVSGKSKGYCEVEFYESAAAAACKDGMDGHRFNGRACVVTFAASQSIKQTSSSHTNKTQVQAPPQAQGRKPGIDTGAGIRGNVPNYPTGDTWRNLGRGGQGMLNKGPVGGPARGRGGPMRPRNMFENTLDAGNGALGGGSYGQGFGGLIHPQAMMAPGIDPGYMGRGAGYGGFSGPSFPGMMAPFPAVNPMGGSPGVGPQFNPAFFAQGMPAHPPVWTDTSVVGWEGEEHGLRTRESSYGGGDDNASEYGYGQVGQSKGVRTRSVSREKERGIENVDEREPDRERHEGGYRYREENDSYRDNRQKELDSGYGNDLDWGQYYHKSRSSNADYAKRRRPSE